MSDPVAANLHLLKTTLSPTAFASIAKWYGKAGDVASAELVSIDTRSMTLNCKFVGVAQKTVLVVFKPKLSSYADAQERLLEMKAISEEGLGKVRPVKISSFRLQEQGISDGFFLFTLFPYLLLSPSNSESKLFAPARIAHSYVSVKTIGMIFAAGMGWHGLNTLYTWRLCWKHSIPFGPTVAYTGMTMFTGFHTWVDMRKRIREARIAEARKTA
ncbi:hypothetical protein R3P38DRAFT_2868287 [Favolaschia claudopus]|uniref:DUF2470 domain-containing protein n=1 Tax=Favolaschia claudopus TaxID=2862362 RepID=A0AAW0D9C2_9AGAR